MRFKIHFYEQPATVNREPSTIFPNNEQHIILSGTKYILSGQQWFYIKCTVV